MVCTFQKSCHLLTLSKMLMGKICNWLLQGNGAVLAMLPDYGRCTKLKQNCENFEFKVS